MPPADPQPAPPARNVSCPPAHLTPGATHTLKAGCGFFFALAQAPPRAAFLVYLLLIFARCSETAHPILNI